MKPPPPQIRAWVTQVVAPIAGLGGFIAEIASGKDRWGILTACLMLMGFRIADRRDEPPDSS